MHIPTSKLERFASELISDCLVSRQERIARGIAYKNMFLTGDDSGNPQIFNKTWAYIDDLESLLYSPVGLRIDISSYGAPSPADRAKSRAAASDLHSRIRQSSSDTAISDAVGWSLVKGKTFCKLLWERGSLSPNVIQPEMIGVLQENLTKLDENMEAFVHCTYITPYQFERRIWRHSNRNELVRKSRLHMKAQKDEPTEDSSMKQVIVGGLYPFQAQGSGTPNNTRGIVDWMGGPAPTLSPRVMQQLLRLDELWVWDDNRQDWATFQMIGDNLMIFGKDFIANAFAFDPETRASNPHLEGHHPFAEFCPNRSDGYFWGRSEIINIALLQIAINSRINGINSLLRMQEDPPKKFTGSSGVNQLALSRLSRPGGYFSDPNPNAKVENMAPALDQDLFQALQQYERMFDEMGGLPPIAKGHGESGVRSQAHAETLVRMFSPRFKDRALLVERDVESFGGLALDICKAYVPDKLRAWVPKGEGGLDTAGGSSDPTETAPAPNLEPIEFLYSNIGDKERVTVDAHSSSPAFAMESRALIFDLFKIGAASAEEVVRHVDAPDPDILVADIEKRAAEAAAFAQAHPEMAAKQAGHKK